MAKQKETLYKLLLIGDSRSGKPQLNCMMSNIELTATFSTVGIDFKIRRLTVNKEPVKLQIWDTAGQERFRTITTAYYRGTRGIFLVFNPTLRSTYDSLPERIRQIKEYSQDDLAILMIAFCCDEEGVVVSESKFEVDLDKEARVFADSCGIPLLVVKSAEDAERALITMVTLIQCNTMDKLMQDL